MVAGVEDEEFGQLVGALIATKSTAQHQTIDLTLGQLRSDLRSKLAGYKLPTVLRVVQGELPKGGTGKVQKKVLTPQFFPTPGYESITEVQTWRSRKQGQPQPRL